MPAKLPTVTGGHVNFEGVERWNNRPKMKRRQGQVRWHVAKLVEMAKAKLPPGTRFVIAVHGNIDIDGGRMEAIYQSTAEMMFGQWPVPEAEVKMIPGWVMILMGEAGDERPA